MHNLPKLEDKHFNKPERIRTGPYEIMEVVAADRDGIATSGAPEILGIERLKKAFPLLNGTKLKVKHHASRPTLDHDYTWLLRMWSTTERSQVLPKRGNTS